MANLFRCGSKGIDITSITSDSFGDSGSSGRLFVDFDFVAPTNGIMIIYSYATASTSSATTKVQSGLTVTQNGTRLDGEGRPRIVECASGDSLSVSSQCWILIYDSYNAGWIEADGAKTLRVDYTFIPT